MKKQILLLSLLLIVSLVLPVAADNDGKVLDISVEYGFIFLDLGDESGIEAGDIFIVLGAGEIPAARVKITKVYTDLAEGDIIEKMHPEMLRAGLRVVLEREPVAVTPPTTPIEPVTPPVTPDDPVVPDPVLTPEPATSFSYTLIRSLSQDGVISHPVAVAVSADRQIYFTDTRHHAVLAWRDDIGAASLPTSVEDPSRRGVFFGRGSGQFIFPSGLACHRDGTIIAVDTMNHRLQVIERSGKVLREIGGLGATGGRLLKPTGIAVSTQGDIFVADTGNDRIQQFTINGSFVREIGATGAGRLSRPYGVAVSGSGELFVADSRNHRIVVFNREGGFVKSFGNEILRSPRGLTFAGDGNLYIADPANYCVQVFSSNGGYIGKIDDWAIERPFDLAWHPAGFLLVADAGANALLEYRVNASN